MKSRAWAFKAAYTRPILVRHVLAAPLVSIVEAIPAVRSLQDVEPFVEAKLGEYVGLTLDQIATRAGGRIAASKSGPAAFVRRTLGLGDKGTIEEFEKLGIRVHTLWLRDHDLYPWEAVSFPAMRLREFAAEDWEESELLDHVDNILFVPLLSPTRSARGSRALGRAFFWKPSGEELAGIEKEWRVHQRLVRAGKARYRPKLDLGGARRRDARGRQIRVNDLPKTSDTKYIHMRPHGRDSADWDVDPRGNRVTKQCFWLNKALLQSSARNASPPISE